MDQLQMPFVVVCLFIAALPALGQSNRFEGHWVQPDSQGITAVDIQTVNGSLRLRAFGRCDPKDCDWGEVAAQPYSTAVNKPGIDVVSADFDFGFARSRLTMYPEDTDRLRLEVFTVFVDASGRSAYHTVEVLRRSAPDVSSAPADLTQPVQLSPPTGSVFSASPRTTTLQWSAVAGAAKYGVEVDCYHCCKRDQWCSDVGGKMRTAVVDGLTYTFAFPGAQPGRWRVWAIGPSGEAGPKSGWWEFRYTR
jgi:hypothetical protein